jgi:SAM-dependent methyltransferase
MCHASVIEWFLAEAAQQPYQFNKKRILEVGSKYVNGSVRPVIEKLCSPKEYIGVDIESGKYVDVILPAEKLMEYFGENSFDVVISTELLEHVKDWRLVINNMKDVLKPKGLLFVSTRSYGFPYHGYPYDYWRYEIEDIKKIFSDFIILFLEKDPLAEGLFLKAHKPERYVKNNLADIALYSIAIGKCTVHTQEISIKRKILLGLRKYGIIKRVI